MRDHLHGRLTRLLEKTASAKDLNPGGWWVGDVAGERRVQDDLKGGRLYWRSAHDMARRGLEALACENREMAESCAWEATDLYIAALETRIRPSDMAALGRSSQRRGRPRKK